MRQEHVPFRFREASRCTARALEELSERTDRPKTYFIEKALESYLAECADYQVSLDRLRDKDDPIISSADLKRRIARKTRKD